MARRRSGSRLDGREAGCRGHPLRRRTRRLSAQHVGSDRRGGPLDGGRGSGSRRPCRHRGVEPRRRHDNRRAGGSCGGFHPTADRRSGTAPADGDRGGSGRRRAAGPRDVQHGVGRSDGAPQPRTRVAHSHLDPPAPRPQAQWPVRRPTSIALDPGPPVIADRQQHRVARRSCDSCREPGLTGEVGFTSDGGSAVTARFNQPSGVAVDGEGNARRRSRQPRRARIDDRHRHDPGGDGGERHSGDGGPARDAQLSSPFAVAVDASGDSTSATPAMPGCAESNAHRESSPPFSAPAPRGRPATAEPEPPHRSAPSRDSQSTATATCWSPINSTDAFDA